MACFVVGGKIAVVRAEEVGVELPSVLTKYCTRLMQFSQDVMCSFPVRLFDGAATIEAYRAFVVCPRLNGVARSTPKRTQTNQKQ